MKLIAHSRNFLAFLVSLALSSPTFAGLITSVVETGGDNNASTPVAQYTGQTFFNPNSGVNANYTVPLFGEDVLTFTDRNHQWNGITNTAGNPLSLPSYLVGNEYIMIGNNNRDNAGFKLDITLSSSAKVYLLVDNRLGDGNAADPPSFATNMTWLVSDGFTPVKTGYNRQEDINAVDEIGLDEGGWNTTTGPGVGLNNFSSVYEKTVGAGVISLLQADNSGRNMYGVVVAVPEPSTWCLLGLGALTLLIARRMKS